ncbi:MAG: putative LPS assembly protein LptD [Bacteroidota bacterium]
MKSQLQIPFLLTCLLFAALGPVISYAQILPKDSLKQSILTDSPPLSDSLLLGDLLLSSDSLALIDTIPPSLDSLALVGKSDSLLLSDSLTLNDSTLLGLDSLALAGRMDSLGRPIAPPIVVPMSADSLDAKVDYSANDSMHYDIKNERIYLYGEASVQYNTMNLTADYIIFDWAKNTVYAEGLPDSLGRTGGNPEFKDGDQSFKAKKMRYNFETRKGIIYDVTSQQGNDMYVLSSKAKFISPEPGLDSTAFKESDDVVYSSNSIFTTCNHPNPHFGIRSRKQKVVPNKLVIVGPSNLEIASIPTPLWLPFGFFPISKGKRTGLIFPRDYEFSETWGFGLRDVGWFFPLGEYFNLQLTGEIYTRGTWGIKAFSRYDRRYRYSGDLTVAFSNRRSEFANGLPRKDRSWSFRWSHRQAPTAHPTNNFSVSANIQTNNFQSLTQNDFQSVSQNQLNSTFTFSKNFPGTPFRLSVFASHNQNTQTRDMRITLPTIDLQMNRIYPFKRKIPSGPERWYEKLSLQYTMNAQNQFVTTDTTLFSSETLENAKNAIRHTVNSDVAFNLFKHFNLSPRVDYAEIWHFKTLRRVFDPTPVIDTAFIVSPDGLDTIPDLTDTTSFGTVTDIFDTGFRALRLFNASLGLNTNIFGVREFQKGFIRGIRHTIKPSISANFTPDYTSERLGYFEEVQTDSRFDELTTYSIFDQGLYDRPSSSGLVAALSYTINNIFEAKYFSKKDSTINKFRLFDNIVLSGNHNFAADSLQWSEVRLRGNTRIFKKLTNLQFNAAFDPYAVEFTDSGTKRRINTFYKETNGKYLRFDRAMLTISTGMSISQIRDLFTKEESGAQGGQAGEGEKPPPGNATKPLRGGGDEALLDLFENFRISHNFSLEANRLEGRDTIFVRAHTIRLSGRIKLTEKWNINVGNISYDFNSKRLVYPDLGFSRDLHCWEMGMSWRPERGTYNFYIRVKPGTLDFLEIPYKKNNQDALNRFR